MAEERERGRDGTKINVIMVCCFELIYPQAKDPNYCIQE